MKTVSAFILGIVAGVFGGFAAVEYLGDETSGLVIGVVTALVAFLILRRGQATKGRGDGPYDADDDRGSWWSDGGDGGDGGGGD